MLIFDPLTIVGPPYHGDHNLYKLKSSLPKDNFTQVKAFLAKLFLRRIF